MTIYARGYRPYEGPIRAGGLRWLPIAAEGYRDAIRGKAYRFLFFVIGAIFVLLGFFLYFESPLLTEAFLPRHRFHAIPTALVHDPSANLEAAVVLFHEWTSLFVILLTLFVGSGLIAEDLKARALPLYLVRPITPFDYYLGKLLIPVRVLARAVLAPALLLVLLAALFRPSDEIFEFLGNQGKLVKAILIHFAVLAVSYSSVALLFSAWTARRITSIVLGSVTFLGGVILNTALQHIESRSVDPLRAASISADVRGILYRGIGREPAEGELAFAGTGATALVLAAVVLLTAFVIVRRARTVEVTA